MDVASRQDVPQREYICKSHMVVILRSEQAAVTTCVSHAIPLHH